MKNPGIYNPHVSEWQKVCWQKMLICQAVLDYHSERYKCPKCRCYSTTRFRLLMGRDAFSVEIIQYPGISDEALNAVERWWVQAIFKHLHLQWLQSDRRR